MRKRMELVVAGLLAFVISGGWVLGEEKKEPTFETYRLQFTLSRTGQPDAVYELAIADGSTGGLSSSSRVAIPTPETATKTRSRKSVPVVSFTYRNLGFTTNVKTFKDLGGGCFLVGGSFSDSNAVPRGDDTSALGKPSVSSLDRSFSIKLCKGKSLELARVTGTPTGEVIVRLALESVKS